MNTGHAILAAATALSTEAAGVLLALCLLVVGFIVLLLFWFFETRRPLVLTRTAENPVLGPNPSSWWESAAVFNPAAVVHDGRVHLFYRALGQDGISRIGHASSLDGIHFDERSPDPVYDWGMFNATQARNLGRQPYRPLSYRTDLYASGGGWGGCEDPRAVKIGGKVYMTFGIFGGWQSLRLAVTSLALGDFSKRAWAWARHITISPQNETHKNWVLFPEKIGGQFAILHALTPQVLVDYVDSLENLADNPIRSNNNRVGFSNGWDSFVRGAAAPPIKTPYGWLLFYHGMDPAREPHIGYKVGALLLDLNDPTKILYRSQEPVLTPAQWYEHDWKPNVVYASGAVVWGEDVVVYYGGGDKYIAAAKANLRDFVRKLMQHEHAVLTPVKK
ncbi:hypothetical protein HYS79_01425 [Patescibacteria group bacterium]|nr:hypothetical protein [Patescibacteria group bacterium]